MSTKVGIGYDQEYYLYKECFENDFVYLRLENQDFSIESSPEKNSATMKISIKTWRKILDSWINSDWAKHPEWDNREENYDIDGLLSFLESKNK